MAAINFPNTPAINEKFPTVPVPGIPTYTWDGEKWTTVTSGIISGSVGVVSPSSVLPKMDADPALIGVDPSYALGDHVHPRDTTKADVTALNAKADLTYVNSTNAIQDTQINTHTSQIATKIGEAPNDGKQYARKLLAWSEVASSGGGGTGGPGTVAAAISDTPPSTPFTGQFWWESDTGQLFIWVPDGTSDQWVAANISYTGIIAQNIQSTAYTTVMADAGKSILHPSSDTSARTWTIDSNANVPYTTGTQIMFINQNGAGTITIAITTDTMRLAGAGTTGSRTLAANGIATANKLTNNEWLISGTGLT